MKRLILGLAIACCGLMAQSQPQVLQNGWLAGNTTPTSCSSGTSADFFNSSEGVLYRCIGNQYSPQFGAPNGTGPDILNGKGNFAVNGLNGWTAVSGPLNHWVITNGNLVHAAGAGGTTDTIGVTVPIIQRDVYLGVTVVTAITNTGYTSWQLGDNCNSDCGDNFVVGTNTFYADACCDSGPTLIELTTASDTAVTIHSFVVSHVNNQSYNTAGGGNIGIGAGTVSNITDNATNSIAIGVSTLHALTTGFNNVMVGTNGGAHITTGNDNVGLGVATAFFNTTGSNNTAIGFAACNGVTGSNNVCLGSNSTLIGTNDSLAIETNSDAAVPLIGGNFVDRTLILDATITTNHGGSANKAICWKSDGKTLGYCSTVIGSDGSCTCN